METAIGIITNMTLKEEEEEEEVVSLFFSLFFSFFVLSTHNTFS
jgi:hypothetical protein